MKKIILTLLAALAVSAPAFALEADVAQFDVWVDNSKIEHKATEYPLLVYKDITYFPMTYDYVRMLGLTSSWTDGCFYLSYCPPAGGWPDAAPAYAPETAKIEGEIATYPIYVNGKPIDNSKEEYPVFNARGITYFPMTWRFATEEFGMDYIWNGRLIINANRGNKRGNGFTEDGGRLYFETDTYEFYPSEEYEGHAGFRRTGEIKRVFDPSSRTVTATDYCPPASDSGADIREKLSVNGGSLMYENTMIADISDYVAAEKQRDEPLGINVFGYESDLGGGKSLVSVSMRYLTKYAQPHSVGATGFWFIKNADGSFDRFDLGFDFTFAGAEYVGGKRYMCVNATKKEGGTTYVTGKYLTYILNDDNSLVPITDADHENIRLLGSSEGKPVVLATWLDEYVGVSAVNDGYFTVESDGGLRKIYPYVFGDGMTVYDGHLYLLIWRNKTIVDVTTGEEIKF